MSMNMVSPSKPASYWIAYGFCEGPRHARYLQQALKKAGFTKASDILSSDIIIAHSGACFVLPTGLHDKTVFLCQPAIGYEDKPGQVFRRKLSLDVEVHKQRKQLGRWVWKTGLNLGYSIIRASHNRRFIKAASSYQQVLAPVDAGQVVVVISRDDPYSRYLPASEVAAHPTRKFLGITGGHEDLWTNPNQLVDVIAAIYKV